jgi:AI-2 transport protein TqsA
MSTVGETIAPAEKSDDRSPGPSPPLNPMTKIAACLVVAALSWYLLKELAPLLRPLLLAVFLGYVILPLHWRLARTIPRVASIAVLVGGSVGVLFLLGLMIQDSVAELEEDLPRLTQRAQDVVHEVKEFAQERVPWLVPATEEDERAEGQRTKLIHQLLKELLQVAANAMVSAVVVGIYLLFLLLEVGNFPRRVRRAFGTERADRILAMATEVNHAIVRYLQVKVKASLLLAVPVAGVLWVFGVKFAVLWGALTFLCNFIPYIGSIVAVTLPLLFAFLGAGPDTKPLAAAIGVLAIHLVMTYVVEPRIVGRGVGLSPLVVLIALAFWGLCWGLVGMFLAIPLTMVLKIALESIGGTRPAARLLADE